MLATQTKKAYLQDEVERLRVVVALQRMSAHHGFAQEYVVATGLPKLWRAAHTGTVVQMPPFHGDPRLLVSHYVSEALTRERQTRAVYAGADDATLLRVLRDNGLQTVFRLRAMLKRFQAAGGDRPATGWRVPYMPYEGLKHGELEIR